MNQVAWFYWNLCLFSSSFPTPKTATLFPVCDSAPTCFQHLISPTYRWQHVCFRKVYFNRKGPTTITQSNCLTKSFSTLWRALSKCLFNPDRLGASTPSPGSLLQCLATLLAKKCFLVSVKYHKIARLASEIERKP